jgi:hypothetical protein
MRLTPGSRVACVLASHSSALDRISSGFTNHLHCRSGNRPMPVIVPYRTKHVGLYRLRRVRDSSRSGRHRELGSVSSLANASAMHQGSEATMVTRASPEISGETPPLKDFVLSCVWMRGPDAHAALDARFISTASLFASRRRDRCLSCSPSDRKYKRIGLGSNTLARALPSDQRICAP